MNIMRTIAVINFVPLEPEPGSALLSPKPIFDYLAARGHHIEGEYVHVEGWPVRFLPLNGALAEEALRDAVTTEVAGVPTRVFSAEHLVALPLESGRAKDKARVLQFVEAGVLDAERLQGILQRHNLVDRWRQFERTFFS